MQTTIYLLRDFTYTLRFLRGGEKSLPSCESLLNDVHYVTFSVIEVNDITHIKWNIILIGILV